ncbi:hypothetical protein E2320_014922, partial [Naja naja]
MEKDLLIGDKSCVSYGSDSLLSPKSAQETSSHSSLFEGASAPPYELMNNGSIHKKQGSGKNGNNSVSGLLDQQPPQHLSDSNALLTSEQEIKDAFLQYTAMKFCYSTAPAKHLKVQKLTPLNTFRYRLETFTESRDTHLASECYYDCHKKCSACNETGFNSSDYSPCSWCSGTGNKRCFSCRGNGQHMCYRCDWKGILLYHTELSITWKNNILEYTADNKSELPVHHLQERQTVELVPLTKVKYEWKGKLYSFYVFGNENKVYSKDYPAKCCCSI